MTNSGQGRHQWVKRLIHMAILVALLLVSKRLW